MSKISCNNKNRLRVVSWVMLAGVSFAATAVESNREAYFKVNVSNNKGSEIQLEAQKAPLDRLLDTLAKKTKVAIHFSSLPQELVTATCVGSSLKPVLECLFAGKATLAYRGDEKSPDVSKMIQEVWVTGSSLAGKASAGDASCLARAERAEHELKILQQRLDAKEGAVDMTDDFVKMTESDKAETRAAAIGALLSSKRKDEPAIKAVLEKALTDQDPAVRAQAVSTMAQGGSGDNTAILQDALQDESVDVRLMAVSAITDNIGLLRQAANDSDETVRTLATMKLQELEGKNK